MSLPVFQATIVNDSGDIIPSAVITVLDEITGLGLTIYSDRAGTVPLGTSGVFTAGTDGFAQFFAPAGNYRVKAEQAASGFEKTWNFVPLVGGAAFVDLNYFGTAATADTGLATGNVPTADQLSMVGETVNYTGANLNPNVFGGVAGFKAATGYARSATALRVDLEHSAEGVGHSLIKGAGSFNVTDTFFNVLFVVPPADITIATQNQKLMTINISGLSGLVADRPYFLTSIATNSTLEVV